MVYHEDAVTKTHDGGLNDLRKERKIVWVFPSSNITRCPVRLVEKYLSLCPQRFMKRNNFYLHALSKPSPKQWYGCQVVGTNYIGGVVKEMMKEAKIEGLFTNHSLSRTGGIHLFQAGIDRKIVKEATGHRSDAVDAYQITSEAQHENISKILSNCSNVQEPIAKSNNVDEA